MVHHQPHVEHQSFQLVTTPKPQPVVHHQPHVEHQSFQLVSSPQSSHPQPTVQHVSPPQMIFSSVEEMDHPVLQATTPSSLSMFPEVNQVVHHPALDHSNFPQIISQETPLSLHQVDDRQVGSIQHSPVTVAPSLFTPTPMSHVAQRRFTVSPSPAPAKRKRMTPSPAPRRRMPTPFSQMRVVGYNTPLHITQHLSPTPQPPQPQPSLPPLNFSPEPVLTHKADPSPVTYVDYHHMQEHQQYKGLEEGEEPRYILQLVPNPKYKSSPSPVVTTTTTRPKINLALQQQNVHNELRRKDPSLYPYLYVLSSYLPQTQHSLVVAKKS